MKALPKKLALGFVLLLGIVSLLPLFHSGFYPMHDDTQIQRVFEMTKSLRDGLFPVRWVSDLGYGYGYPIFNFYAPFAYYIGSFFQLMGFSALTSTKIMIGTALLTSGITMYLLGKKLWGVGGGVISAIFYLYAPYHALDIYVRGDIAEAWAYAWIPLVFLGILYCYRKKQLIGITLGSIGYMLLIVSHNLTAFMVTPFILIVLLMLIVIHLKRKEYAHIKSYGLLILFGLLMSAWYWLPVFSEMKYTNVLSQIGGGADYKDHFVCLAQLWNSPWMYGGSVPGCIDGLSFRVGKLHILGALAALLLIALYWKKEKENRVIILTSGCLLILAVLLLLPLSKPVWDSIHPMAFFQYPWRFLLLISFFSSILVGYIPYRLTGKRTSFGVVIVAIVSVAVVVFYQKLFIPQSYMTIPESTYTSYETLAWKTSKTSDEYLPKDFIKPKTKKQIPRASLVLAPGLGTLSSVKKTTRAIQASVDVPVSSSLFIIQSYFPAWHFLLDGKKIPDVRSGNSYKVNVPPGNHTFLAEFIQTPVEKVANTISLLSFALLLGIMVKYRYGQKNS